MERPKLYQVVPTKDYIVYLYYDNGEIRKYDCSWVLSDDNFKKISEINTFMDLCTIINGTLAWDISGCRDDYNCIDICPDTVYNDSLPFNKDVLEAI